MSLRPGTRIRTAPAGFRLDPVRSRIPKFENKNFPADMTDEQAQLYGVWLGVAALYWLLREEYPERMMRRVTTGNWVLQCYGRQIMEYLEVPAWHHGTANPVESAFGMSTKAGKGQHRKDLGVLGAWVCKDQIYRVVDERKSQVWYHQEWPEPIRSWTKRVYQAAVDTIHAMSVRYGSMATQLRKTGEDRFAEFFAKRAKLDYGTLRTSLVPIWDDDGVWWVVNVDADWRILAYTDRDSCAPRVDDLPDNYFSELWDRGLDPFYGGQGRLPYPLPGRP